MPLSHFPRTPYLVTSSTGGPTTALATVGAVASDHEGVQAWNPFARNDTRSRNIILVGHDADAELRFLGNNEFFNPYAFATTTVVLDSQRLYDMLYPGGNPIGLERLIKFCFPNEATYAMHLHNAGNDAYWELQCCMVLLKKLAEKFAPESKQLKPFQKIWDAVFVCMDLGALNGDKDCLTELGFATLDSRTITNIHDPIRDEHIKVSRIIVKGNVPKMIKGKRHWRVRRYGGNFHTDDFYPRFGPSKEVWPNQIARIANRIFFVHHGLSYDFLAPAGLKAHEPGNCYIAESSPYFTAVVKRP